VTVSKRLRFEILRRDNHACRYCGGTAPESPLTVDHVVPVALGGNDDPSNLVAACKDCNGGKSSVPAGAPLVADVVNDAMRWAAAMQQAANEIYAEEDALEDICQAVYNAWKPRWIPSDYRNSLYTIVKAGLTQEDLVDLVRVAQAARWVDDRWSYFCGCCWKRIKQRQERASQIISGEVAGGQEAPGMKTIKTRWTQEDVETLISEGYLECEDHDDGQCKHDLICRMIGAARKRESDIIHAVRNMKLDLRDDAIMRAAEESETLIDG
jgi:hypothetical protein